MVVTDGSSRVPGLWPSVFYDRPRGEIPIHNHFYVQTMYILSGRIAVASHDPKTDERLEEKILGPNDFVFVPSMEPHSMRNLSDNEDVTFLCCIANIYEEEGI